MTERGVRAKRHRAQLLVLFDGTCCALLAGVLSLAFTQHAWAYVDPSVMTYAVQALAGVAVALSAVAGVAMRRTRRKLAALLGVDANRNKEVEAPVHRVVGGNTVPRPRAAGAPAVPPKGSERCALATARAGGKRSATRRPRNNVSAGKETPMGARYAPDVAARVIAALLVSLFTVATITVVAPYEIVAGNESSLLFGLDKVWPVAIAPTLLIVAALTAVLALLRGRAFNMMLLLVFGFGLSSYVQTLFLNSGLPSADGQGVLWADFTFTMTVTLAVWLVVFLAPWIASFLNRRAAQTGAVIIAVALTIVQGVGVASLFMHFEAPFASHSGLPAQAVSGQASTSSDAVPALQPTYLATETGIFNVAPRNNLFVFVLDGCDTKLDLMPMFESEPELKDGLPGFTWFQNSAPTITPTREAIPVILTGAVPGPTHDRYWSRLFADHMALSDLRAAGYHVGVYTDTLDGSAPNLFEHTMNGMDADGAMAALPSPGMSTDETAAEAARNRKEAAGDLDANRAFGILVQCALYRDLPWAFKPFFWYYTDDINNAMSPRREMPPALETRDHNASDAVAPDIRSNIDVSPMPYTLNDAAFYQRLLNTRLSIVDDGAEGTFRLIHLLGPHFPCTMNEYAQPMGNTTRPQQARGSLRIVLEYLQQLKELGLYDDATIIITADHGYRSESNFDLKNGQRVMSPIMLVKPSQTAHEAMAPLQVSQMPVTTSDIMPTIMAQADIAPTQFDPAESGVDMLSCNDAERERFFYFTIKNEDLAEVGLLEFRIAGDVLNFMNWHPTGMICDYGDDATWKDLSGAPEYANWWLARAIPQS